MAIMDLFFPPKPVQRPAPAAKAAPVIPAPKSPPDAAPSRR